MGLAEQTSYVCFYFVFLLRVFLSYGLKKMEETLRKRLYLSCPVERNFPLSVSGHPVWVLAKELMNYGVAASSITAASGEWCRSPSLSSRLSTVGGKNAVKNPRVSPTSSLASKISPQQPESSLIPDWPSSLEVQSKHKAQLKLSYSTPQGKLPVALPGFILLSLQLESKLPMKQNKSTQVNSNFTDHR